MRAMRGVQLKDRKGIMDFMIVLDLSEIIHQFAIANNVCWYGHVLQREDGHFLRRQLYFEVESQKMKGMPKRT